MRGNECDWCKTKLPEYAICLNGRFTLCPECDSEYEMNKEEEADAQTLESA